MKALITKYVSTQIPEAKQNELDRELFNCASAGQSGSVDSMRRKADIEAILRKGANINANNNVMERTALHCAVEKEDNTTAQFLLGREGIKVNARDRFQMTPLMSASAMLNVLMVGLILGHQDVESDAANEGKTAAHFALNNINEQEYSSTDLPKIFQITKLLFEHQRARNNALKQPLSYNSEFISFVRKASTPNPESKKRFIEAEKFFVDKLNELNVTNTRFSDMPSNRMGRISTRGNCY